MKILHLPLWFPNKEDIQLGNFIEKQINLTSLDHAVFTISFHSVANLNKINLKVSSSSIAVQYKKHTNRLATLISYYRAAKLAISKLNQLNFTPDIIHCHVGGRNLWLADKFFKDKPVVLSEHWSGYLTGEFNKQPLLIRNYLINKINNTDRLISVSNYLSQGLIKSGIKKPHQEIGNVIDVKKKLAVNTLDSFHFLMVADFVDEVKNISGLINAYFKVFETCNGQIKLTIIGDGKDFNFIDNLITNHSNSAAAKSISLLGRLAQENVQDHLVNADCTVVNSYFETFSMICLESILTGCPVIATKCGGPEQFINDQNGLLIEKGSLNELANAMVKMVENKSFYTPVKVRESLPNNYSKDEIRAQLNKVYLSIKS
ncbi:MAG: glycosyltransferase family 4 protein [Parvicellaceae bacterium]